MNIMSLKRNMNLKRNKIMKSRVSIDRNRMKSVLNRMQVVKKEKLNKVQEAFQKLNIKEH
jgi:hypothetical protein